MNSYRLYFFLLALIVSGIAYFASENLYLTLVVGVVFLVYPQLFLVSKLMKSQALNERYHECYHFVNTFIVSLDIRGSLNSAFAAINPTMSKTYLSVYDGISSSKSEDKLLYLQKHYPFYFYGLFTKVITLYQEQGGDILSMSTHLLEEGRRSEEHLRYCQDLAFTRTIEFVVLWIFALIILVVMRVSLNQFFNQIMSKTLFIIGLAVFFLFFLVSIDVLVRKITKKELRGWQDYE